MIIVRHRLYPFLSKHRRGAALAAYGGITTAAYIAAYLLRFELRWRPEFAGTIGATLPLLLIVRLAFYRAFKLSTGRWRFVSIPDVLRLVAATTAGTVVFIVSTLLLPLDQAVPRSVYLIEWVLTTYLTAGVWIAYRTTFERVRHHRSGINGSAKRVLMIGAGEAGSMLAREMGRFPTGYRPIGFVDDDARKHETNLHGLEVLGSTSDLPRIIRRERVDELIVAVPSASPERLRQIVSRCEAVGLPLKVLPGIAQVLAGDVRLSQLREMRIEDLLGRDPIELELPELADDLAGRSVLITGAAGSIGAELARQVALYEPSVLVLLDQAETDLYYLDLELKDRWPELEVASIVADVTDADAVDRVFAEYAPSRVFHAAAYKHVPMMEANAREAIRNNVIGTWRVARAAGDFGADTFALVSTDKAVRPISIMGASKRLAEIVVLELQTRYARTSFGAVRFGNVLGSNGSVIPVFRRQLEQGKPLTVTHPDATRYFMTISEAVQLILQTSLLPELRGHIAMLEMGKPVRILDLAKNLLRLAGLGHTNGRRLRFTGLRPGEKLHEELTAPDEVVGPTSIPKVRLVESECAPAGEILRLIERGEHGFHDAVEDLIERMPSLVPGFPPVRPRAGDRVVTRDRIAVR